MKPYAGLQRARLSHKVVFRPDGAQAVCCGIPKKEIRRKVHAVADTASEDVGHRNAPRLAQQIETRELDGRNNLRSIVVEGRGGIREKKPHLLQARGVSSLQVGPHRADSGYSGLATTAHLAEAD